MVILQREADSSLSTYSDTMFVDRAANARSDARPKLPWPKDRPFKILSLDGGGIRGIFSAKIILEMARDGHVIGDHFDLISGTSTGGIIALALGLRISPEKIFSLYYNEGPKIFPPFWTRYPLLRFIKNLAMPVHDHRVLISLLKREFGDRKLGHSSNRLVIPAFLGPEPQIAVFKTDHHPDYKRDWSTDIWKVARATSAAPTFFAGHEESSNFFLDGGVWANNPIMCAVTEAISSYDLRLDQIQILSIGTGNTAEMLSGRLARAGVIGWRKIINTAMFLTTDVALSQARLIVGHHNIVRLEPVSEKAKNIGLDDWTSAHAVLPSEAQKVFDISRELIEGFLKFEVAPRERYYT